MSDELTPPFEEPEQAPLVNDGDEAVDGPVEYNPFDISSWMDPDDRLVGWTGVVKYIDEDSKIQTFHVQVGLSDFESIGMHRWAEAQITTRMDIESYTHEGDDQ